MQDLRTSLDIRNMLAGFLHEDVGSGDITSESVIPDYTQAHAYIICKSPGPAIACGLNEAAIIFDLCGCSTETLVREGSTIRRGMRVMRISGSARGVLKAERTALNLLMRMSGIATETRSFVKAAKGIKILATRKTAPGLRYFDKKAVVAGGGGTHRLRLDDMVLIKDNHIVLVGGTEASIMRAREKLGQSINIECEATNQKEAIAAVVAGANIVMLDNFTPAQAKHTTNALARMGLRKKARIEISGGVNARNVRGYAIARPDFISLGYITHSPRAVDFSLEIIGAR